MSVYVDDAKKRMGRMRMSHMIADSTDELLAMAERIGVAKKWIQYPGTYKEHFDVCLVMRNKAIQFGAIKITTREMVTKINERKTPMPNTRYVRTPISEPPKEAGTYICILSDGNIELLDYGGFKDSWDGGVLCDPENTQTVISWLKPCTETGAVDEGNITEEILLSLGFERVPHFTVMNSMTKDVGRGRLISIGCIGTPNEMVMLQQYDHKVSTDIIVINNWDYDGYMTVSKLKKLLEIFKAETQKT